MTDRMLLTTKEAAGLLGFSPRSLEKWRHTGDGPLYIQTSGRGCVRYRRADLEEWVGARIRRSTSRSARAEVR